MDKFVLHNKSILLGIQQITDFSRIFFSTQNIHWIQSNLRYSIYKDTGDVIGMQDEQELLIVMRSIFLEKSLNPLNVKDYISNILYLNNLVIKDLKPKILKAVEAYRIYRSKSLTNYTPLDRPISTNITGTKEMKGFSDVLGINTFI